MSAWTSAILCRPSKPPAITPGSLADFLEKLFALDVLKEDYPMKASLKFGESIDQDEKGTVIYEPDDPDAVICTVKSIKFDAEIQTTSSGELLQWLRSPFQTKQAFFTRTLQNPVIYRASIDLCSLKEHIYDQFSREFNKEEEIGPMWFDNASFSITPEFVCNPKGEGTEYMVGWISVNFSGNGYLWPWTYEETLAKIKASKEVQQISELCRSFWPVPPIELRPEHIEMRKSMGYLWGGDDYDAPPDWRWYISESY